MVKNTSLNLPNIIYFVNHINLSTLFNMNFGRYVDISTVDGATSKLINKHIKAAGASFLEVTKFLCMLF